MANWLWQLTDMAFNPIGEIRAKERKVTLPLNKVRTASFRMRMDDPLATSIINNLGYIKIFRDNTLIFYGPIITAQQVGDGDNATMVVNASGPEWIFAQRLVGKTAAGLKYITSPPESSHIFKELLEQTDTNHEETHIDYTTYPISGGSTAGYETSPFKLLSEVLNDLSNTIDGFDWLVYPLDNYGQKGVTGQKIGAFTASGALYVQRDEAVFEWGIGKKNVSKFSYIKDRSTLLNRAWNISSSGAIDEPGASTKKAEDVGSQASWGVQEGMVTASILNEELRQLLVNETINVRKNPRVTITFDPISDNSAAVPIVGQHFNVGDKVHFRTRYFTDVLIRVWGVEFNIDENNKETQTLTLSNDGA